MFRGFFTADIFDCPPFQMFSNGDDPCAQYILELKRFEPHSLKLWCRFAKEASAILDIGAHVGIYSLAAASLRKDIKIHAFEPNPFTAARLRVNKHLNGFDHIEEHNAAIGDVSGVTELCWYKKPNGWLSSGSSLAIKETWTERAPVFVRPLDSFAIEPGPSPLVKIDVEGAEPHVFRGMTKFLKARPTIILETFDQRHSDFITSILDDYRFFFIDEDGPILERPKLLAAAPHSGSMNQLLVPAERRLNA